MSARYRTTLELLGNRQVEFIVVGGIAAVLQGAPIVTFDLDLVQRRTPENVDRLCEALETMGARYRHDPRDLVPSAADLLGPGHHLLSTIHGPLDLLGAIGDGLAYEDLLTDTVSLELSTVRVPVLDLARLIAVKRALGRPKDLAVIPTLQATLDEIRQRR